MMGNWSLGDYFKKEAIEWSFELLTNKEIGFGLDPRRLYVTCYQGDDIAPKDEETAAVWRSLFEKAGIEGERIYFLGADANWWPAVKKSTDAWSGPTGPCTEMFYDMTGNFTAGMSKEEFVNKSDVTQELVEIWNDVFMEYVKKDGVITGKLENKNVDTGSGFERVSAVLQGKDNIFDTDVFMPIIERIRECKSPEKEAVQNAELAKRAERIIADHMRAAVMLVADGVLPANADQGYILRRLIRRAVRFADVLELKPRALFAVADSVCDQFADIYENVERQRETIKITIDKEEQKFRNTLNRGLKELMAMIEKTKSAAQAKPDSAPQASPNEKCLALDAENAFLLYESYGFPIELTTEICKEHGISIDMDAFAAALEKHQELSRAGAGERFKGGLGDTSEMSVRYHTATHLLHQALREVLGDHVAQKGSNITPERLRFDFAHTTKMTDEEKKRVEDIVNAQIEAALPVQVATLSKEEAEKTGALHFFGEKYGDVVTVYFVGDSMDTAFSKEFCGGPHVKNTKELSGEESGGTGNSGKARFRIAKEEAVAQGIRRIKAVLE